MHKTFIEAALDNAGQLVVSGNLGAMTINGNFEASTGGGITVMGNLNSITVSGGGGAQASGSFTLNPGGVLSVGRNASVLNIGSNLSLSQGSRFQVVGHLTGLTVGGNLITAPGGEVNVGGNLGTLSVTGDVQGKGNDDVVVGDDLGQITVLGGGDGVAGLQGVGVLVTTNILGLDDRYGIADSLIQAGFFINGGTPGAGSNAWNIGPDVMAPASQVDLNGPVAVLDSTIQAGDEIQNLIVGGDVVSDRPDDPGGSPTRIVAGLALNGQFVSGGVLDNLQVTGSLVNAVLSASVGPNSNTGYYDQPAGEIEVGFIAASAPATTATTGGEPSIPSLPIGVKIGTNATPVSDVGLVVANASGTSPNPTQYAQLQGSPLAVSTAPPFADPQDPELAAVLSGGTINPTFAPKLQLAPPAAAAGTQLPLPTKSTTLGSVVTTTPRENAASDYAGILAANTNGVIVGPLPTSPPVSPGL